MTLPSRPLPVEIREDDFENKVLDAAVRFGWRVHAERKATTARDADGKATTTITPIKGHRGFFDLTLVHPVHGVVFAELKARKGRLGPGQQEWQDTAAVHDVPGSRVIVELWRPADWAYIEVLLRDGPDEYRTRFRTTQ